MFPSRRVSWKIWARTSMPAAHGRWPESRYWHHSGFGRDVGNDNSLSSVRCSSTRTRTRTNQAAVNRLSVALWGRLGAAPCCRLFRSALTRRIETRMVAGHLLPQIGITCRALDASPLPLAIISMSFFSPEAKAAARFCSVTSITAPMNSIPPDSGFGARATTCTCLTTPSGISSRCPKIQIRSFARCAINYLFHEGAVLRRDPVQPPDSNWASPFGHNQGYDSFTRPSDFRPWRHSSRNCPSSSILRFRQIGFACVATPVLCARAQSQPTARCVT